MTPAVYNKHHGDAPADAVFIGRPSKWGNPFILRREQDRESVIRRYESWLTAQPALVEAVKTELQGKSLVCFCAPRPCHGDILLQIANS